MRVLGGVLLAIASALPGSFVGRAPAPAPARLPVEVAGCERVLNDDLCELPATRTLQLFVPSSVADAKFSVAITATRAVPGGTTHTAVVPDGAALLVTTGTIAGTRGVHTIRVRTGEPRAWYVEARALRKKGDIDGARAKLVPFLDGEDRVDRALAIGLDARIALSLGRVPVAIEGLRRSVALHAELGRTSDRAEDSFALAFALNQRSRRYDEARKVLDDIEPHLGAYAEGHASLPFYRAEIAIETGDLRAVIRGLRSSLDRANRLGLVKLARHSRSLLAIVLHLQGRFAEGIGELRALYAEVERAGDATPCERGEILLNIAFSFEDARRSGADVEIGVTPPELRGALEACPDPYLRGLGYFLLAADALGRGDTKESTTQLAATRAAMAEPRTMDVLQFQDLEARIALAEGRIDRALELHRDQEALALASDNYRHVWFSRVGLGEALERKGDKKAAVEVYLRAERGLDQSVAALPIDEGRGALLSRSERSARAAVTLLLELGRVDEAFAVARRARARLLALTARARSLEGLDEKTRARFERALAAHRAAREELDDLARSDWKLSKDALAAARLAREAKLVALKTAFDDALAALPRAFATERPLLPPAEGELWLMIYRGRTGWIAFTATNERVRATPFVLPSDANGWSTTLLAGVAGELATRPRVVVLPYGPLRALDLHTLRVGAGALVDMASVEWMFDVGVHAEEAPSTPPLVIGDPTHDLPAARAEAIAVSERLGGTRLLGAEATTARVFDGLARASRVHFAGHGVFGGIDGLESRLLLADGQQLGPVEILALPRVPPHVVLSACETGRTSLDGPSDALGLAQSFVVAGARDVIAPTRKVDDTLAASISSHLYAALAEGHRPAEALRRAQLIARRVNPAVDWAAFRIFRP